MRVFLKIRHKAKGISEGYGLAADAELKKLKALFFTIDNFGQIC